MKKEKGSMGTQYSDPSMVTVSLHRVTCTPGVNLFGSNVKHSNLIQLSIHQAEVERHLSKDWIYGSNKTLIEVSLSPTQFAELLTSLNVGNGVPATLNSFNNECFETPEYASKADQFKEEVSEYLDYTLNELSSLYNELTEKLTDGKPISNKEKKPLLSKVESFQRLISDKLPFIMNQFSKHMDKTVQESKAEVDAFVMHNVTKLGFEAIKNNVPKIED